jgi:hypothetical protein
MTEKKLSIKNRTKNGLGGEGIIKPKYIVKYFYKLV